MKQVIRTWWDVSTGSFAEDFGCDPVDAHWQFGHSVSAATYELWLFEQVDGYAHGLPTEPIPFELDDRIRYRFDWRVEVDRRLWAEYRGLPERSALGPDLAEEFAKAMFGLGVVCETDVRMRLQYRAGHGLIEKTWGPGDRLRAGRG
ncbi:hypothetical protein AB0A05_27240 [Streptomyces sp. NPDC046374]|uniref:hypothetical protein n=1 Tax=Streptomyces sp. NPDC046374 TaxID=3154917 RepID=UPI003408ACF7